MALSPPYVEVADNETVLTNGIRALAVIAAAFIFAALLGSLALSALGLESADAARSDPALYAGINALTFVGFFVAAIGFLAIREQWDVIHYRFPTATDLGWALAGLAGILIAALAMGIVVEVVITFVEQAFDTSIAPGQNSIITQGRDNPTLFLYMIPVALFFVGPAEELVFRGVVQGLLRQSLGVGPGLVVTSALFGVGHYFAISAGSAWTYLLVAGALGLVLGAIYEYTENIVVPAMTHGLWNAGLFLLNYYLLTAGIQLPG